MEPLRTDGPSDIEVLLAGLEVGSISELRELVAHGRNGVVVTPNQIRQLHAFWAAGSRTGDVRLRSAERGDYFAGGIHAEPVDRDDHRDVLFAADATSAGGNLGISYDTLMSLPPGGGTTKEG